MQETSASAYDPIAGMYHLLWADWYLPAAQPALQKLFFSRISPRATVLDLCCGSGHVTKELVRRGYTVTGVDSSPGLIEEARRDLPAVHFHVQDARRFALHSRFEAVLSTFDSLNHILSLDELHNVFLRVHAHLQPDGLFFFDMNLEQAYFMDLRQWSVTLRDEMVSLVRGMYDREAKLASTELVWFVRHEDSGLWEQHRSTVQQRCYSQAEILLSLQEAGFRSVEAVPAVEAGVSAELGFGRIFFAARA